MDVTFARERVIDIWDEVQPLLEAHWREISHYLDIPLDVAKDVYNAADANGNFRCFTARSAEGLLIGYAAFFVRANIHYQSSRQAVQDVLFLHPDHRRSRIGINLIAYADEQLRADGVQVVYQHVKLAHNFGSVLERMGYEHVENIYAKRLDR